MRSVEYRIEIKQTWQKENDWKATSDTPRTIEIARQIQRQKSQYWEARITRTVITKEVVT